MSRPWNEEEKQALENFARTTKIENTDWPAVVQKLKHLGFDRTGEACRAMYQPGTNPDNGSKRMRLDASSFILGKVSPNSLDFLALSEQLLVPIKNKFRVLDIIKIFNEALCIRSEAARTTLFDPRAPPIRVVHGTSAEVGQKIASNGFRPGTEGRFGAAVYLALDPRMAMRYCRDAGDIKTLIVGKAYLGRPWYRTEEQSTMSAAQLKEAACDSIVAVAAGDGTSGAGDYTEVVVFNPEMIVPQFIIELERKDY